MLPSSEIREGFYDSTCGICSAKKLMIRVVPCSPIEVSREMVLMPFVPVKYKVMGMCGSPNIKDLSVKELLNSIDEEVTVTKGSRW